MRMKGQWICHLIYISLLAATSFFCSCSGGDGKGVSSRVISAYGGEKGVESILSYTARGYLKILPVGEKVINLHLDLYQDRDRYRVTYVEVEKGEPANKWIWINDGSSQFSWTTAPRMINYPGVEYRYLQYRFPMILELIGERMDQAEVEKDSGDYILSYRIDPLSLEVRIDGNNGYILKASVSDEGQGVRYSESYSDYRRVEGIPFPNRAIKSLDGRAYCEFFTPAISYSAPPPDSVFAVSANDTTLTMTDTEPDISE